MEESEFPPFGQLGTKPHEPILSTRPGNSLAEVNPDLPGGKETAGGSKCPDPSCLTIGCAT